MDGRHALSKSLQIATAAIDATGMCLFIAFAVLHQPESFQALVDLLNADGVAAYGSKILAFERDFIPEGGAALIFVNNVHRKPDAVLHDGDTVGFFPPIGGG